MRTRAPCPLSPSASRICGWSNRVLSIRLPRRWTARHGATPSGAVSRSARGTIPASRIAPPPGPRTPPIDRRSSVELGGLNDRLVGDVVLPGDEAWEAARQAWNLAADQRPVAVVYPESAD